MDLTIHPEIALKGFTVLREKHNKVLQTKNASLVTSVLKEVDFIIHVLLGLTSHIPGRNSVTFAQLEVIVILMKQERTCHVKEMSLVE